LSSLPLQDAKLADELGRQARQHVESSFSRAKFGSALETIIKQTLA